MGTRCRAVGRWDAGVQSMSLSQTFRLISEFWSQASCDANCEIYVSSGVVQSATSQMAAGVLLRGRWICVIVVGLEVMSFWIRLLKTPLP